MKMKQRSIWTTFGSHFLPVFMLCHSVERSSIASYYYLSLFSKVHQCTWSDTEPFVSSIAISFSIDIIKLLFFLLSDCEAVTGVPFLWAMLLLMLLLATINIDIKEEVIGGWSSYFFPSTLEILLPITRTPSI